MRRFAALLLGAALLTACLGPKPQVESVSVEKDDQPGKANVTVVVVNTGGGDGSTSIAVTVRDSSGGVVGRKDQSVELKPHERLTLVFELDVPEDAEGLQAEAEAKYPPD